MNQLVIVDIQPAFPMSEYLVPSVLEYSKKFDDIVFIYDCHHQEGCGAPFDPYVLDMYEDMAFNQEFRDKTECIGKEFGFLRGWMDTGVDNDDIISIVKYMIEQNIGDSRDIAEGVFDVADEKRNCDSIGAGPHTELDRYISQSVTLVGGGQYECLAEIDLLLQAMGRQTEINYSYVYG